MNHLTFRMFLDKMQLKEVLLLDKKTRVFAPVNGKTHQSLTAITINRRIPLYQLVEAIFVWAGEKDVQDLVKLGVNLPVYE